MRMYASYIDQEIVDPEGIMLSKEKVNETIDFLEHIDSKLFTKSSTQFACIHGDPHNGNLLFSGFDVSNGIDEDEVTKSGKCTLIDYELAFDAPYVYELAGFFYSNTSYPRKYAEEYMRDKNYQRCIIKTYLESFRKTWNEENPLKVKMPKVMEKDVEEFLKLMPYATLIYSYLMVMIQIEYFSSSKTSVDPRETLRCEYESFRKVYSEIFGDKSLKDASEFL